MGDFMEGLFKVNGKFVERTSIRTPVWHSREVGLAAFRARRADIFEVQVKYKLVKADKAWLPKVMTIMAAKVRTYPLKDASGTPVHMVPISAMEEKTGVTT